VARETLKARLRSARITQDDLALLADCSRTYVCAFLSGRRHSPRLMKVALKLLRRAKAPNALRTTPHVFVGLGYKGRKRPPRPVVPPMVEISDNGQIEGGYEDDAPKPPNPPNPPHKARRRAPARRGRPRRRRPTARRAVARRTPAVRRAG